jgi:hypothetical protein
MEKTYSVMTEEKPITMTKEEIKKQAYFLYQHFDNPATRNSLSVKYLTELLTNTK